MFGFKKSNQPQRQAVTSCPCGCAAGVPVCVEGWRLYDRANEVYRQIEQRCSGMDVVLTGQDTSAQLLDEWYSVAGAYSEHIGDVTGD